MEHIRTPKVENVKLLNRYNSKSSPSGTLYLTTTHLIFVSNPGPESKELWILHMSMRSIEKPSLTTCGTQIRIFCWNFLNAVFLIQRDKEAQEIYFSLLELSRPKLHKDLFCFSYNPKGELSRRSGWFFHDLSGEYQRMGIPNSDWSLTTTLNGDYSLCPTYSSTLAVPKAASPALLAGSAAFRARGRLPVLTYLHKANGAAILRCAQPLVGIAGTRSSQDEAYVELLRRASPDPSSRIYVLDTRPAINAMANKAGGKGYENEKFYENIKFFFKGIDNIHKMRNSLDKLVSSVANTSNMNEFLSELCNSGWLRHIKAVLECALAIVYIVADERSNIIVHCSDGWDRTSQTCALAELMLDPYYRTVTGFQALVEKDWLAFGHKFEDRCGHLNGDQHEVSPIFAQFLDCVWQLTKIFPQSFQFNEHYLITMHEHVYSKQYGTFFGNSEKQRKEFQLEEKTYSLWGFMALHYEEFVNPIYEPDSTDVLRPEITSQRILFWSGLYTRFEEGSHPREPVIDLLSVSQSQTSSLEDHGRQLSQTISNVKSIISSAKAGGKRLSNMVTGSSSASFLSSGGTAAVSQNNTQDVEKKFAELKTTFVEKCQSKLFNLILEPSAMICTQPSVKSNSDKDKKLTINAEEVRMTVESIAVEWKPWRSANECICSAKLDGSLRRYCRSCGSAFCVRCIAFKGVLPGHHSLKPVPVCNLCHKDLKSFNTLG